MGRKPQSRQKQQEKLLGSKVKEARTSRRKLLDAAIYMKLMEINWKLILLLLRLESLSTDFLFSLSAVSF